MKRAALIVAVLMLFYAPAAHAGFLIGASAGNAGVEISDPTFSFDESDTGFTGRVGYRFLKFVGVEAAYVDFGEPQGDVGGGAEASTTADGFSLFVVGALPIVPRFEIFGKIGYFDWDAEGTLEQAGGAKMDFSDSGSDFSWGAGVGFKVIGPLRIRAEYEVFKLDDADVNYASIGADLRF